MRSALLPLFVVALSAARAGAESAPDPAWEEISRDDDGIVSWQREVPGSSFVAFKAQGVVDASLLTLAGILRDSGREKDWMEDCIGSANLETLSPIHEITYNRTGSPVFFIADRDVVLESAAELVPSRRAVHIAFHDATTPKAPLIDGVVRMRRIQGYWDLERVSEASTRVTYQVEADPGGALPAWLVNWVSKELSANTIRGLRKECRKGAYAKDLEILQAAVDWDRLVARTSTSAR